LVAADAVVSQAYYKEAITR